MLKHCFLCILIWGGLYPFAVFSQQNGNLKTKAFKCASDSLLLDSLSIVPGSVKITANGKIIDSAHYTVDDVHAFVIWQAGYKPPTDSVDIIYRTLPFSLGRKHYHKDIRKIEPDDHGYSNPFTVQAQEKKESFMTMKGLEKRGSISRGINLGNNQDLSVNSNLDLQLSGKISDQVRILAAISDDNIPIQPEGNTQQLQDFDQVYIQLYDEHSALRAGDFELNRPKSYFMNYYKRAQGLSFSTGFKQKRGGSHHATSMHLQASAAVSKGKFARNIINGIEGNQGPYRLKGAENETYIIILSGTERVFIDGKLLIRGQENDYVIDYNTAEITFTARQLITKDKRIIAEFQYSDKNYARSLFQFNDGIVNKRLKAEFNFYAEQDARNQPLQIDLSDEQKALLSSVGDSIDDAVSWSVDSVAYQNDKVLYKMIDSLGYDSVFVYSTNPDSAYYHLTFSKVGEGKGNYNQVKSIANGRVYQWIAPDTVANQILYKGSYEPVIKLITPKKKQMITLGASYKLTENTIVSFEGALSNEDVNTFSKKDASDNIGHALKIGITNKKKLSGDTLHSWQLVSSVQFEEVFKNFSPIEWFRPVEFDRDWNIRDAHLKNTQYLPSASIGLIKQNTAHFNYDFHALVSEKEYNGYRNRLTAILNTPGWKINASGSLLQTDGQSNTTVFSRNKAIVARKMRLFTLGIKDEYENNLFRRPGGDSLLSGSYRFFEWEAFITNADTSDNRYSLSYLQRKDYASQLDVMKEAAFAQSLTLSVDLIKNPKNTLRNKTSYRILRITDNSLTNQKPDSSLLSRIEYGLRLLKGGITSSSFYEIGSGMEQKKEFSYIEVAAGQGLYAWSDYNGNGIKELDEFEVAAFQDQANFIRVYTPTNEYVKTFTNQFNQAFNIRPEVIWHDKKGLKKMLARFADQVSYRISRKTNRETLQQRFNPFLAAISDTTLISLNSSLRNTLYFNKSNPTFGIDLNYQDLRNKVLLTNGFDSRTHQYKGIRLRWNITRQFLLNGEYIYGVKAAVSDYFSSRNFRIKYLTAKPELSYQPGTTFRISLLGEYTDKDNATTSYSVDSSYGGERAILKKIGSETRITSVGKGSLLIRIEYIQIGYALPGGETPNGNSALSFEMLEGLLPGQNATWSLSWQRTLANNLQLNLNYNGRVSENTKVIHAGGVQLRAYF